jgi:hypothetical protein
MIIGNTKEFAIQYELDDDPGGDWLFGKMCYWIGGAEVGDYALGTSLRDVLLHSRWIMHDCGKHHVSLFVEDDIEKLFYTVDSHLYGGNQPVMLVDYLTDVDQLARFDVTVPVDVFASWKVFLFDFHEFSLLVFRNENNGLVRSCHIALNEFGRLFKEFYSQLDGALMAALKR